MGILNKQLVPLTVNNINVWTFKTDDTLATVTATGYLSDEFQGTLTSFRDESVAFVETTDYGVLFMQINVTSSGEVATLVNPYEQIGAGVSYTGSLTSGNFATYSGTTGVINDLGYLPSNAAKTTVVMASAAVVANRIACFSDTAGTVNDDVATAINGGNIQAGLSGTAGYLSSFPTTASKGSLRLTAVENTGDTVTTISNAAMGQASTISIPDPGASTANFLLSAGANTMASGSSIVLAKVNGIDDLSAGIIVCNGVAGVLTTQTLSTAGGSTHSIAWTNSYITSTSIVIFTWAGGTNTVPDFTVSCVPGSGSAAITIYNNTSSTAFNGRIKLSYLVL